MGHLMHTGLEVTYQDRYLILDTYLLLNSQLLSDVKQFHTSSPISF